MDASKERKDAAVTSESCKGAVGCCVAALSLLPVLELEDVPANKLAGAGIFTDAAGRLETARWPKCVFALKLGYSIT